MRRGLAPESRPSQPPPGRTGARRRRGGRSRRRLGADAEWAASSQPIDLRSAAGASSSYRLVPNYGTAWYHYLAPMITDVNPFVYSHPLEPEDVIDRDDEARELLTHAVGGHFVRLFAPRKFGKTSL